MAKRIDIIDDIYGGNFSIFVEYNRDKIVSRVKGLLKLNDEQVTEAGLYDRAKRSEAEAIIVSSPETEEVFVFIDLPTFDWSIEQQSILLHELTHVIQETWISSNIPFDESTKEPFAYYFEYIYKQVMYELQKYKNSKQT